MRTFLLLLVAASTALAREPDSIAVLERSELAVARGLESPSRLLRPALVYLDGSGWTPEDILAAVRESARIFAQCGVALDKTELLRVTAPRRFRDFYTPVSRELARALNLGKPTVYFVAGTRQRPAFDAEAIGRGNSRSRPELADTVWVTRGARDLGIVLAHELAHVLMDDGGHSEEAANLMRDETAPDNMRLSATQCARLRDTGTANGLLGPPRNRAQGFR
jgi:hypothetical protein